MEISEEERGRYGAALLDPYSPDSCLYIPQLIRKDLNDLLSAFITRLNSFQVRTHQKTPLKAKKSRRLVYGLREILRHMRAGRIKFLIVAADLEQDFIDQEEYIEVVEAGLPIVYGLDRHQMGKAVAGNPRISIGIVGVLSVDGAHQESTEILNMAESYRNAWTAYLKSITSPRNLECIAAYYGHLDLLQTESISTGFIPSSGDTSLHIAAARGYTLLLQKLVEGGGFSVLERNYQGHYPTHLAVIYNRKRTIQYLRELFPDQIYWT